MGQLIPPSFTSVQKATVMIFGTQRCPFSDPCLLPFRATLFAPLIWMCMLPSLHGQSVTPTIYLSSGTVECVSVSGDSSIAPGSKSEYIVALTDRRALVGWTAPIDNSVHDFYAYWAEGIQGHLVFSCQTKAGVGLLDAYSRKMEYVLQQADPPSLPVSLQGDGKDGDNKGSDTRQINDLSRLELNAFSNYSLALFFSSCEVAATPDLIYELFHEEGEVASRQLPYGLLTMRKQAGGIKTIELKQNSDNFLNVRASDLRLNDAKNGTFKEGLLRLEKSCTFEPPINSVPSAPWIANCIVSKEGNCGRRIREEYRITAKHFVTDVDLIEQEIDKIVLRIPDGTRLSSNGPIGYQWKNNAIEIAVDPVALRVAGGAAYKRGSFPRLIVIANLLGLLLLAGWAFWSKRLRTR